MANKTETSSTYSEASFVTSKNDLKHKFYRPDVSEMIVPVVGRPEDLTGLMQRLMVLQTRALLKNYSHIPVDAQPAHIEEIVSNRQAELSCAVAYLTLRSHAYNPQREKAWKIRAHPCIGLGVYLVPQLRRLPAYPEIIQRLVQGQVLADIGCFIGHDLRHLVNDGAPTKNLYGFDRFLGSGLRYVPRSR